MDFSGKTEDGKTYEPSSTTIGKIDVTEEEFVLVFRAAEKVSDNACCYMVINEISLSASQDQPAQQDKTPMKASNDTTIYLMIGGAALLVVISVVVIVIATKKKKD